jgi:hypothetical protein
MAIQGLWAGPWLRDVAGLDRMAVADHLFWVARWHGGRVSVHRYPGLSSQPPGDSPGGGLDGRRGHFPRALQLTIALGYTGATLLVWLGFGFFGTSANLSYAVLSQKFPRELAGRVNTALNLLVFVGAFVTAVGPGRRNWISGRPPPGGYAPHGYSMAFGLVLILQLVALSWYGFAGLGRTPKA